ncbi:MAG: 3,4-dihydroxy-2-butanone-4-phosphate synthase, partial [Vulcanimicrobiaceae bacterium]
MGQRFADDLNEAIKAAGFTAAELAERSGLTEAAISLLRAGRRSPTLDSARRLSSVLPALAERLRSDMDAVSPFDSMGSAIADIRAGKMVVVLDDEDRENEGDLVMAAQMVTAEAINFMRKEGGGLICVPMLGDRLDELHIPQMVRENSSLHETAFSVSVEARGRTTTGISAQDRAATIQALL